ncbi:MAG: immune inhibitor A [Bacteroidaceae bacterium]|nr:immune inhibitor A [Bacteroidaceae bacterium]
MIKEKISITKAFIAAALFVAAIPSRAQFFEEETEEVRLVERQSCFIDDGDTPALGQRRTSPYQDAATISPIGKPKIPVMLVQFTDVKDSLKYGTEDFGKWKQTMKEYFNGNDDGTPYVINGFYLASIKDYFKQQSDELFVPEFVLLDPVTLTNTRVYYRSSRSTKFTPEVLALMAEQIDDPSEFDGNGDGKVDVAMVVFAGTSSNFSHVSTALWAWESTKDVTVTRSDSRKVTFASSVNIPNQLYEDGKAHAYEKPTIGVPVHEFCHALGLPDFYDTSDTPTYPGMDVWSLMDYGENINSGYTPTNLNAVERDYMGWRDLVSLDPQQPQTIHLTALGEGGVGYKMQNYLDEKEYFVLECRNTNAKDCDYYFLNAPKWLDNHMGLIVYHLLRDNSWGIPNNVNVKPEQKMTILPANNTLNFINNVVAEQGWEEYRRQVRGHMYPGTSGNTTVTDESVPATVVYTGDFLGQPIYDIFMDEEYHVHLKYMPRGILEAPTVFDSSAGQHQVTLSWEASENASCYALTYRVDDEAEILVDSLKNTAYVIDGLQPGTRVTYSVVSMDDEWRNSEPSEWQEIDTPTDVQMLRTPQSEQMVSVYSLTGVYAGQCVRSQVHRYVRTKGIVVLRYEDGATEKVFIQ